MKQDYKRFMEMNGPEFADFLTGELMRRGISILAFTKAAGLHNASLYRWRSGKAPSIESRLRALNFLGSGE